MMGMTVGMLSDSPCHHDQSRGRGVLENQQVKRGSQQARKDGKLASCQQGGMQGTVLQLQVEDVIRSIKSLGVGLGTS